MHDAKIKFVILHYFLDTISKISKDGNKFSLKRKRKQHLIIWFVVIYFTTRGTLSVFHSPKFTLEHNLVEEKINASSFQIEKHTNSFFIQLFNFTSNFILRVILFNNQKNNRKKNIEVILIYFFLNCHCYKKNHVQLIKINE